MPVVEISATSVDKAGHNFLAVPFFEGAAGPVAGPGAAAAGRAAGTDLASFLARQGFRGRRGESAVFFVSAGADVAGGPERIAAIGVGRPADAGAAAVRDAAQALAALATKPAGPEGQAARLGATDPAHWAEPPAGAGSEGVATTLALVGPDRGESVRAAAEGYLLGSYRVPRSGSRPVGGERPGPPAPLTLLLGAADDGGTWDAGGWPVGPQDVRERLDPQDPRDRGRPLGSRDALDRGIVTGQLANWVRDLVHAPAGEATPEMLAETITAAASGHGVAARIWTAGELADAGFGGVLGVGQGSRNMPRMAEITHGTDGRDGGGGSRLVALAGKGITFDSGGLNLKRDPGEISWMRADMAGGAAVAAAVIAAARMRLAVPVTAVVPLAENMPGGGALRPGDVLTHRGGRTSQVMDTDSEGRLVVADALAYLAERSPAALIDVATLTDAAGLGPALWAALGTEQALLREVLRAGEVAGEPGWPLPLPDAYRELLASPAADLRNVPARGPDSTVMAAMFLREFAGRIPWVHIDNGSTAWLEYDTALWPEGATGSPVRALIRFLERRATG